MFVCISDMNKHVSMYIKHKQKCQYVNIIQTKKFVDRNVCVYPRYEQQCQYVNQTQTQMSVCKYDTNKKACRQKCLCVHQI